MDITSHDSVLRALECWANQYKCKGKLQSEEDWLLAWTLDKTGTINTLQFLSVQEKRERYVLIEQQERNRVREFGLLDKVLRVNGVAPASKGEGIICLMYEDMNGISNTMSNNNKLEKAKEIHDELEVNIAAYNKHRLNLRHCFNENGFNQMFKGGEAAIQSVTTHNTHEIIGCVQEGGTSLLAFRTVTEYLDHHQLGKDKTGLGQWSVMTFKGDNGFQTRVVCGYNPCYNRNLYSSTSYQQHRGYFIRQQKELNCPWTKFCEDLVSQLLRWQQDGDKLIVCLDAKEDIFCKSIKKALKDINELAMKEVVGDFTHQRVGATFFRGSKPFNGMWATSDILISNTCIMPAGYGIRDHRLIVIDFCAQDIIGSQPPCVVRATSFHLNTRISQVATEYERILEEKVIEHRLIEQVGKAYTSSRSR